MFHHAFGIGHKQIHHFPAAKTTIFHRQIPGHVKMVQRDHRLYPIFMAFLKNRLIESKPLFIGFLFLPLREYPGPAYAHPVTLKPHFTKQTDILFIIMIKVYRFMAWVKSAFINFAPKQAWLIYAAPRNHILNRQPFPPVQISSFALVSRRRASPQKILWKYHD